MIPAAAIAVQGRARAPGCGRAGRRGGAGMTLIELLVSLVIVSILATITMAGLSTARTSARKAKTQATIRKISEVILPYYEQYETRRPVIGNSSAVAALANGRTYLTDAKQTAIRRLMALELPERASDFRDVFTAPSPALDLPYGTGAASATVRLSEVPPAARRYFALTRKQEVDGSFTFINPTSSELLHLIVTRGPVADPDIIAHFRDDEVRDTNGNGLPEFVDGWNKPIAFRRWPVGFDSPMQTIDGSLRSIETLISGNGHRLVPLIFSAGPDGGYDIVQEPTVAPTEKPLSYLALEYDPFSIDPTAPYSGPFGNNPPRRRRSGTPSLNYTPGPLGVSPLDPRVSSVPPGTVVLTSVPLSPSGPVVFRKKRIADGHFDANDFQTVGSERDTGSADNEAEPDGVLQSRDNITNHDLTR
jgi:prepilin-type N-terminal cleavage/methylation domain-containing protein